MDFAAYVIECYGALLGKNSIESSLVALLWCRRYSH